MISSASADPSTSYNHLLQLSIDKLVYGGDGLARLPSDEHGPGKAVFMPFVLEGEKVQAELVEGKKGFARARATQILQASADRIEPGCAYFGRCGGCHYQHASYEHQLRAKAAILGENLRRIGKVELPGELVTHPSEPWNYRNRTRLKVRTEPEFSLGYYRFNSHELLAIEQCPISSPLINKAIAALWQAGQERRIHDGIREIELFANADDSALLMELYFDPEAQASTARKVAEQAKTILPEIVGVAAFAAGSERHVDNPPHRTAAVGVEHLLYVTTAHSYRVSAGAFFQVNRCSIDNLVGIVTRDYSGQTAIDLYAGVGLFSTSLSGRFAHVTAVESSQTSYADLLHNSPPNVEAVKSTTEQFLARTQPGWQADLVIVDPPRSGLGQGVVRALAASAVPRVTYVSCDPATVSRDLAGLLTAGFRIEQAHLIDLFPQTFHIESVFHLIR